MSHVKYDNVKDRTWFDEHLIGWKFWSYINNRIEVFSSKVDSWDDIPQDNMQAGYRYYDNGKREQISGLNIYTLNRVQDEKIAAQFKFAKLGLYVPSEDFHKCFDVMKEDTEKFV